uniref:BRO1 domain-containing protein n=1 Tax=Heterorhabditis bacteriophora TaxID=37862 RepID=A0A1I7W8A8_HETBA
MDMPHAATYDDIGFELACVMYNIGAVHAAIAVNEMRDSEDSIKNAFMHFQYAAWPLQHLRDKLNASKYASVDFDKDLLTFYVNVLLGQAQECLVEKSLIDHRSNLVVAKLTVHLRDLYQECLRHLDNSSLSDIVSSHRYKQWLRTCAIKSEMYGAIAMIYMGLQADENKKMGERLGYYSLAGDHQSNLWKLNEKEDRETMKAAIDFLCDVVMTKYAVFCTINHFFVFFVFPSYITDCPMPRRKMSSFITSEFLVLMSLGYQLRIVTHRIK